MDGFPGNDMRRAVAGAALAAALSIILILLSWIAFPGGIAVIPSDPAFVSPPPAPAPDVEPGPTHEAGRTAGSDGSAPPRATDVIAYETSRTI